MPQPFQPLTLDQFAALLARFPFRRRIDAVHMHHTWKPARADYRGLESIVGMWRFHTQTNGWSDLAQHVSIAPDGIIWTGRDWNAPPASASGHNGTRAAGPFMFEMIGNFDRGREPFDGRQREVVLEVIARVQERFKLPLESLVFHRQMTDQKSCPGTGIERTQVLAEVGRIRQRLAARSVTAAPVLPFDVRETVSEAEQEAVLDAVIATLTREVPFVAEPPEAEVEHGEAEPAEVGVSSADGDGFAAGAAAAGPAPRAAPVVPPELLVALRPYLINLTQGRLSGGGLAETSEADVDAIFREHLPRALAEAGARGEPLRLMVYAHGGLVSEAAGLRMAAALVEWWKANHVYPLYFVWETGLWETLSLLLQGRRALALPAERELTDVSDRVLEEVARRAGGGKLWGGMKYSAERSVGDDGGARYAAERLAEFCAAHPGEVELHAVGHSAGSIFHSYFLPTALELGAPPFKSLSLLAPAIRTDVFQQRLAPLLQDGRGLERLSLFTMYRQYERADQCGGVYRKSLLYLVANALEPRRGQPLLGLEESLRADARLRALLGLDGAASTAGEVVWSPTQAASGRGASRSTSHGGFDNDTATMESVLRRVLDADDDVEIVPFPQAATRGLGFGAEAEALEAAAERPAEPELPAMPAPEVVGGDGAPSIIQAPALSEGDRGGRRRALCIGIDRYATAPLHGCVADARLWARTLQGLGFEVSLMLDAQATRDGILRGIEGLLGAGRPGDVLVLQYAGHGTHFADRGGDEADGQDEALVPIDYNRGAFVLDDEQRQLFDRVREGVNLTCFYDCCHSGTMARYALDSVLQVARSAGGELLPRFIEPTPQMQQAYRAYRAEHPAARAVGSQAAMRAIAFSACRDDQVALEQNGQGLFTGKTTRLLADAVAKRSSHAAFQKRIVGAFGANPPQNPVLDCAEPMKRLPLLQPLAKAPGRPAEVIAIPEPTLQQLLQELKGLDRSGLQQVIEAATVEIGTRPS